MYFDYSPNMTLKYPGSPWQVTWNMLDIDSEINIEVYNLLFQISHLTLRLYNFGYKGGPLGLVGLVSIMFK